MFELPSHATEFTAVAGPALRCCLQPYIEGSALPVDVVIGVTNTCPDNTPGTSKSAVFSVTADPLWNPNSITGVQIDVSIPAPLQSSVTSWICVNGIGAGTWC
jgi:hypothetical protein